MAGNVKEWVWNAADERRYILGGAWHEPSYMFTISDAAPPLTRLEGYGFRCAEFSGPLSDADPLLVPVPFAIGRDYATEQPVGDDEFEFFRSHYVYDRTELNSAVELVDDTHQHWRQEKVRFDAAYRDERMFAYLFLPRNARPPYQTVVYFPAGGAFRREGVLQVRSLDFIVQSGRAAVYPIFQNTHERYRGPISGAAAVREMRLDWFKDLARTLDYLETRADIDHDRIAMYGFSTDMLPIFHALEPRLKTGIVVAGMLSGSTSLPEVDPCHFAPRVTVPILMLNGRNDAIFPMETRQVPLFRLFGTPAEQKRHVTFESHHVPPRWEMIKEFLDWLDRYLGPVIQDP
jgi:dienelactone hydrolase